MIIAKIAKGRIFFGSVNEEGYDRGHPVIPGNGAIDDHISNTALKVASSAVLGGDFWQGAVAGFASSFAGSFSQSVGIHGWGMVGISAASGGAGAAIAGGRAEDILFGMVSGAMVGMLNHMQGEVQENIKLRKYVEAMFPGRIPANANVKFKLSNSGDGLTEMSDLNSTKSKITVSISKKLWRSADDRLLIDCIDHELVHVEDYASGRSFRYYVSYGADKGALTQMVNIMEYKAYSQNQWYNLNMRSPSERIDYSGRVNQYKNSLPVGWWNIK